MENVLRVMGISIVWMLVVWVAVGVIPMLFDRPPNAAWKAVPYLAILLLVYLVLELIYTTFV